MRRGKILVSILAMTVLVVLLGGCITAPKMSYQGKLTDPSGNPVPDGNYNMHFRLWGTNILPPFDPVVRWEETQNVAVTGGLFNVALGSTTPLTPNIFIEPLQLGIEINGDGEMTPRQPLYGAPYAMTLVDGALMGGTNIEITEDAPGMFNISNLGSGYGIAIQSYGKAGVGVDGVDAGLYGVLVDNVDYGAAFTSSQGIGVRIQTMNTTPDIGTDDDGVSAHSRGEGVYGRSHGTASGDYGVLARADGGSGLYAWTQNGTYGGYFDDPIFVNGGCTGCSLRYVGRNSSNGTLQPGAAVSSAGVEFGLEGMEGPVMQVVPATPGQPILGVVVGRVDVTMVGAAEADGAAPGARFDTMAGPAAPGDYLVIVVQGPAQVQAAPDASIAAGSLLYMGGNGVTTAAAGPAIGMALDQVDADGLVWVLVGFH